MNFPNSSPKQQPPGYLAVDKWHPAFGLVPDAPQTELRNRELAYVNIGTALCNSTIARGNLMTSTISNAVTRHERTSKE